MINQSKPNSSRTIFAWALYDFANQPFATLIITFIYATFFTEVIAPDPVTGTVIWSHGITITGILVAVLSPWFGALADQGGYRRFFLVFWTWITIGGSLALYWIEPGQVHAAIFWIIIANTGFEMGTVFCNAYLPEIAPPDRIGRISGYGWSFGYVGGLLALVLALVFLVKPDMPLWGLLPDQEHGVRATTLLVAIWFAVFSIPTFLFLPVKVPKSPLSGSTLTASWHQLASTFRNLLQYRSVAWLLLARLFYNDGLITVFAFGGIYAAGTFGFTREDIFLFGIVLNITAGMGAFLLGFLDDWIGSKRTIQISNVGLILAILLAVLSPERIWFWVAGIIIGICSGPNQASSRALLARLVPAEKQNEFFGFFAFSGKATSFMGPFLLGTVTALTGSQRWGVATILLFIIPGIILLRNVVEEKS